MYYNSIYTFCTLSTLYTRRRSLYNIIILPVATLSGALLCLIWRKNLACHGKNQRNERVRVRVQPSIYNSCWFLFYKDNIWWLRIRIPAGFSFDRLLRAVPSCPIKTGHSCTTSKPRTAMYNIYLEHIWRKTGKSCIYWGLSHSDSDPFNYTWRETRSRWTVSWKHQQRGCTAKQASQLYIIYPRTTLVSKG